MGLTDLTANSIDGHEPQRTNNCLLHFDFTALSPGPQGAGSGINQRPIVGWSEAYLLMSLSSFPIGGDQSLGVIEMKRLNESRKFAGNPTYGAFSVTYNDYLDVDIAGQLYAWFVLAHNPINGQTAYASSYKIPGYVIAYPPNGTATGTPRQWNAMGCWISDYNAGDADLGGEGEVKVSITIQIDKILPGTYGTYSIADVGSVTY